jgi:putative phosphoribosyl transferase
MHSSHDQPLRGFRDRAEAGSLLAESLAHHASRGDTVVLGLPRGGVPVAFEIATRLRTALDIVVVLKLSSVRYPELALGAVAGSGSLVLNDELVRRLGISAAAMDDAIDEKRASLGARARSLRGDRPPIDVHGANVIVVDDGLATGASMRAAIAAIREQKPANVVAAVPVASREAADSISSLVNEFVCVSCPSSFVSVGNWYRSFTQVRDEDVRALLDRASRVHAAENGGHRA